MSNIGGVDGGLTAMMASFQYQRQTTPGLLAAYEANSSGAGVGPAASATLSSQGVMRSVGLSILASQLQTPSITQSIVGQSVDVRA